MSTADGRGAGKPRPATASWRDRRRGARLRRHGQAFSLVALGIAIGFLGATAFYAHDWDNDNRAVGSTDVVSAIPGPPLRAATSTHIQPTTLSIPAIGLTTKLVDLGLNVDRSLRAPTDYQTAGWFAAGPAPGDTGGPPAVIAGHVDSASGPAIFYRLHELTEGSVVEVSGIDQVVQRFKVYRTANYAKSTFPAPDVYASSDRAELRLITCTGEFDRRAGSYLSNLIVYAALADQG